MKGMSSKSPDSDSDFQTQVSIVALHHLKAQLPTTCLAGQSDSIWSWRGKPTPLANSRVAKGVTPAATTFLLPSPTTECPLPPPPHPPQTPTLARNSQCNLLALLLQWRRGAGHILALMSLLWHPQDGTQDLNQHMVELRFHCLCSRT